MHARNMFVNGSVMVRVMWQGWPRGGLSRAASTGAVEDSAAPRTEFGAVRSKSVVRYLELSGLPPALENASNVCRAHKSCRAGPCQD